MRGDDSIKSSPMTGAIRGCPRGRVCEPSLLQRGWLLLSVLLLGSADWVHAEPRSEESGATALLMQTLTLVPGKAARIDLPEALRAGQETVRFMVAVDGKVVFGTHRGKPTLRIPLEGRRPAKFEAFLHTSRGRRIAAEVVAPAAEAGVGESRVTFAAQPRLTGTESFDGIGFRSDAKLTLLGVRWLDPGANPKK